MIRLPVSVWSFCAGPGLRVGELLDLELGSVIDYGPAGTWLKVPGGRLATERMVPLSAAALTAFDEWTTFRGSCRPLPHPRTGQLTDFLFVARGYRLGLTRLRNGLIAARRARWAARPGRNRPQPYSAPAAPYLGHRTRSVRNCIRCIIRQAWRTLRHG
jgi:integrase